MDFHDFREIIRNEGNHESQESKRQNQRTVIADIEYPAVGIQRDIKYKRHHNNGRDHPDEQENRFDPLEKTCKINYPR